MICLPIWIVFFIPYTLFCAWVGMKQYKATRNDRRYSDLDANFLITLAICLAPIWFIAAFIVQFIIRKWD